MCEELGESAVVSDNSPKLAEFVPRQAMLSGTGPEANLANSEMAEPVLTIEILRGSPGAKQQMFVALHTVDIGMDGVNLTPGKSQTCTLLPPSSNNQSHEPDTGPLSALYERDSAQREPYTAFRINHPSTGFEDQDLSVPHHNHALEVGFSASPAQPLPTGGLQTQTHMEVPEMLSRFLRVNRLDDSLRHEAGIAISEGRVQEGEDMVKRKMLEEYWQWSSAPLSTMARSSY